MDVGGIEIINFPDMQIPVRREPTNEIYLALEPPEALPYVVAPFEMPIGEVVAFIQQHADALHELRAEMIKHFKKTKSLRCRFRTGDVAYLLGRPFMLRCYPLSSTKKATKATRTRTSLTATMNRDISVIDLYVAQVGNYDQGRAAFMSYAQIIFSNNIKSLLQQCMERVFPGVAVPANVRSRPMRDSWVRIDEDRDTVWFSVSLIPFPAHAVVYTFLNEAVKLYAPQADEDERVELIARGVPNWQEIKALLANPDSRFVL